MQLKRTRMTLVVPSVLVMIVAFGFLVSGQMAALPVTGDPMDLAVAALAAVLAVVCFAGAACLWKPTR